MAARPLVAPSRTAESAARVRRIAVHVGGCPRNEAAPAFFDFEMHNQLCEATKHARDNTHRSRLTRLPLPSGTLHRHTHMVTQGRQV